MRFFIEFSYKGTNYHGWQIQPNANTIQSEINNALSTILHINIDVMGAGRTDAGVHAKQMFAHFNCDIDFDSQDLIFKLNRLLPVDIVIHDIFRVRDDANCRFDALSRTYQYHIIQKKNPFNNNAYLLQKALDIEAMNEACKYMLGNQDFTSFAKVNTQTFTNNCNVMLAKWEVVNNEIVFTIKANRFLRNMVRAITGTILDVGLSKIEANEVAKIIAAQDRAKAGTSLPSHALFLISVQYPNDIRI
ncbi:MAG: tRNA pseudouridine(38-40) synthase TruA [Bacteroidota bacterium]|nr:tRNA pseudouridine(38-40) synthase TruA [Bacteroidota bacterium]